MLNCWQGVFSLAICTLATTMLAEPQLFHQKRSLVTKVMMGHKGGEQMGQPHEGGMITSL